jgi:prevent-host-death family protein
MAGYRIVPKTVLRDRLRHEFANLFDQDIVVTSRSRPIAVIVSISGWNALQDKIERLEEAIALMDLGLPAPQLPGRWRDEAGAIGRS